MNREPEQTQDNAEAESAPLTTPISVIEFAELFRASFRVLWLIAAGTVTNKTFADDIVQEAALTAFTKRHQFTRGTNFTAWMGQVVRFTALNLKRREKRQAPAGTENEILEAGRPLPTGTDNLKNKPALRLTSCSELPADQEHFDDEIVRALQEVSADARTCLLLRIIENLEYQEIALILEIPEGTAMSHVHRTKKFLRERLCTEDITITN